MGLKSGQHEDVLVLTPDEGRLDAQAALGFKRDFTEAVAAHEGAVGLDLGAVSFMDSSGLGAIVACFKGLGRGRSLVVFNVRPAVRKVFELTRIDRVLPVVESLDEALQRCRS
jgi:anti-sigma B factor antagonist